MAQAYEFDSILSDLRPVEGVDFRADGLVFVGDDAVGDAGVDEGHLHAAVSEQRGDRFQAHPAVDRLGGQGVTQREGLADAAARREHPVDEVGDAESDGTLVRRSQPTSVVVSSGVRARATSCRR
ncbi:hypothetical protein RM423_08975 [Jatrophihabitans sp. DSM 44399]|uniref:Uncharacterized protein n=1 Tax=Jatrophihabitans lederbergiae TaxID=3075547 RepID=A0ABU2J967_9ACTN|nr:hypothetical protein [Jatrophihabitans sp. DSM 44399]MDT0261525.1 hypothetical protein [Jatrophihabitans sp. DSM 44399]